MIVFIKMIKIQTVIIEFEINTEMLFCSLSPEGMDPIIISCVYRPENGGEHCLQNIYNAINCLNFRNIVILGDLNFLDIDW